MKNKLSVATLFLLIVLSATQIFAQQSQIEMANAATQEMQKSDPQSAQAFQGAIQRGDFAGAKKIYEDFKSRKGNNTVSQPAPAVRRQQGTSLFESTLSGNFTEIQTGNMAQFGYDLFNTTTSSFIPPSTMAVGPDYIIGPGDQFTLTLWGTTEGIYTLQVTKEGEVTLPKVGVISVAGIRFGQLENTLKRHLSKYYSNFNLSIAMGGLKTLSVYVVGEVSTPGSYALPSLTTVYGALFAAGGPTKKGTLRTIQVLRSGKVIKTIDIYDFLLKGDRSQDIKLQNEDTVFVPLIGKVAGVAGAVYRPAIYEMKGETTLAELIQTAGGIMPTAFSGRVQLNRFVENRKQMLFDINISSSSSQALKSIPALQEKIANMDVVKIFPMYSDVWEVVNVGGAVQYPGDLQWTSELKVKEVIRQAGLLPTSDLKRAEVIRLSSDFSSRDVLPIDISALMKGDEMQNIALQPRDQVRVYSMYRKAEKVVLNGEVARPGTYEIMKGERLSDLLQRAGGFTSDAYAYGAVFKRPEIKTFQTRQTSAFMISMQERLLQQAAQEQATALSAEEIALNRSQVQVTQQLLDNLKAQQNLAEGRVALNITEKIETWANSKEDPVLQDGDSLDVPKRPQEVSVIGQVYNPGAVTYEPDMTVMDYIGRTGGYKEFANRGDIFVLQANGFAVSKESLSSGTIEKLVLSPGDAIMVPQKVEREAKLRNTRDIVDIVFKTAVSIATIMILF